MLILMEPFEQWTNLKDHLANYRLNSSILPTRVVSFLTGKPPFWGPLEGVLTRIAS
jgi:hypothetical protein